MDHLICVIDANTLLENIQEIKRFIQQGQIRLVVPQCTSISLEQKCAKLKEEASKKPTRQPEAHRPRSGGKPAKIEHPALDINPLVAGEFLARLRADDGQNTVEFQKDSEQYSPWKMMELEEESRSANENRPTTFAQAVQKQNIERLLNSAGAGDGPMKPRLVARSGGADGSPWKKSNKALSLPISEVAKEARPILSCLLWRLQEKGATRWDTDRTTLLCDSEQTNMLAKKLGISAKSMKELRIYCEKPRSADSRETFGDLEEHFGVQGNTRATASGDNVEKAKEVKVSLAEVQPAKHEPDAIHPPEQVEDVTPSSPSTQHTGSVASAKSSESEKKGPDVEKVEGHSASKMTEDRKLSQGKLDVALETVLDGVEKGKIPGLLVTSTEKHVPTAAAAEKNQEPTQPFLNTLDFEKEHSIAAWVRSLTTNGELSGRTSPVSASSNIDITAPEIEAVKDFKPLTYRQAVTGKTDEVVKKPTPPHPPKEIIPSPRVSPVRQPSPKNVEDPIDSDEEIVVFNPKAKRLSAQKAQQTQQVQPVQPAQQAQRPQTPTSSPRASHARNASGGRPQSSRGTNQRPSRPGPPPVVIDPDSFGRHLVTNPQPTVARTFSPYGAHGRVMNTPRGHHRPHNPRPFAQNTPTKVSGAPLAVASPSGNARSTEDQLSTTVNELPNAEAAAASNPHAPVATLLKASPMINGSSTGPPPSAPSGPGLAVNGSPNVNIRPERPRYSPRHTPATSESEVPFILRSGQPREATRGRGKLWIP
ncbi:MAG: hypothetical protein Q9224_002951 [Gallowayella concinna]